MRKPLSLIVALCCIVLLASSLAWAGPRGRNLPNRYLAESLDGRLVETLNPVDGTRWAAWAYRNGAEYDLAIAFRDEQGFWSEPLLIGVDDDLDQTQPALAADNWGNIYLAYTEQKPDRIMLTWLAYESSTWSPPIALTDPSIEAMYPALHVTGESLIVAFRAGRGSVILDLPLLDPVMHGDGLQDMPDPVGAQDPIDPDDQFIPTGGMDPLLPLDDNGTSGWETSN